jgi:catechol 2,3-dioxygenase-like lactoylglutathione lyase family enzyme
VPSNRRWSVSDGRKLATGILVVVAVFILSASIGAQEWELAAVGVALLAAGAAIYVLSSMNSRTFVYVPGTALVRSSSPPPATALLGRCEMQVLVRAPGMDDVAVRIRDAAVPVSKWPDAGARLPILVASGDPRRVRVLWDNVRTNRGAAGRLADMDTGELYGEDGHEEESFDGETYDIFDEFGPDLAGEDGGSAPYGGDDTGGNVVELDLIDPAGVLREPESPVCASGQDARDPAGVVGIEPGEDGFEAEASPALPAAPTPRPRPRPSPSPRPSPRPRRPADAAPPPTTSDPASASPTAPPPMMLPPAGPGTAVPGPAAPPVTSGPAAHANAGSGVPGSSSSGSSASGSGTAAPHGQVPVPSSTAGHGRGRGRDRPAIRIQHMLPALPAVRAIPDPAPPADEPLQDTAGEISDAYLAITRPPGQDLASEQAHGVGVTLSVSNLGRSVAFYRDVLGFQQVEIGPGSAVLESGDGRMVLRRELDMEPVDRRLVYLLLEVPDVQAAYEDLHAQGVEFVHRPRAVSRYEQLELWSAAFRDPDGHGIAVTCWDLRK